MIWSCPREIEEALWAAAKGLGIDRPRLARAIVARSRRYTSEREEGLAANDVADREGDLAARALFFSVADVAKVMVPLAELTGAGQLPEGPIRIADVGAGVGAMSLGAAAWLGRPLSVHAVDRDAAALRLFERTVELLPPGFAELRLVTELVDAASFARRPGSFDLILCGSLLNELEERDHPRLLASLLARLAPAGAIIIIEPALRSTSRALHRLRDWAITTNAAGVFAPCVRRLAPCPALADEQDWCHEDRPTELPPRAAELSRVTGLRSHGLKFAYLVLRQEGGSPHSASSLRVVSQVRKLKGRRECIVCGDGGRYRLRLLNRNRSSDNRELERARRGDVISAGSAPDITVDQLVELYQADRC